MIVYLHLDFHDFFVSTCGEEPDCITGRVSLCFGAELCRLATWKQSPGKLQAFSCSFAQPTGITGSEHQRVLLIVCFYVFVYESCVLGLAGGSKSDRSRILARWKVLTERRGVEISGASGQSAFNRYLCLFKPYLAVAQHDYPDQHHVDFCSQRFVMIDLIYLMGKEKSHRNVLIYINIYNSLIFTILDPNNNFEKITCFFFQFI